MDEGAKAGVMCVGVFANARIEAGAEVEDCE